MSDHLVPARQHRTEITVSNSRFIASAAPAFSVDSAKEFINAIREEFRDATHNVPAFLIGHGTTSVAHCSDDGEPSGTAGRPILAVLQGSNLGDIAIVVTRFFGGTKLGTGGLVRAYGEAAKTVLGTLPFARKTITHTVMMSLPYTLYEQFKKMLPTFEGICLDEEFSADVTISVRLPVESYDAFQDALTNLSRGTVNAVIIEANKTSILPFPNSRDS